MTYSEAQIDGTERTRPAKRAAAGFVFGEAMARKNPGAPRPRTLGVPRHPNGRINHRKVKAEQPPERPYFAYAQRVRGVDGVAEKVLLIAAITPERKLYRKLADEGYSKQHLERAIQIAEDQRLGYSLGSLWIRGLLCPKPEGYETPDEAETRDEEAELLDKAGRIYVALHYFVWRWQGSPCQAEPSFLSTTMAEVGLDDLWTRPATELDDEEFEKERLKQKAKLRGARLALERASPMGLALKAVDRICIDNFDGEIHPGALNHLRRGLKALKEYFDVRKSKPSRERQDEATMASENAGSAAATTPPRRRGPRPRMPANLTSDETLRPPKDGVARSVGKLLKARGGHAPAA